MNTFVFSREVKKEILEVDRVFENSLISWWDKINNYTKALENDLLWYRIPEFVLIAYEYFGVNRELAIKMANIFKIIYLTNYIHETIKDDEEGQEYNQKMQFSILIGDYLFGQIMTLLLEANCEKFIDTFACMMIDINEGLIIKYKIDKNNEVVTRKTKASYFATAFITAARLAGIENETELKIIKDLGISIGYIMCLITNTAHEDLSEHLIRANQLFLMLNQRMKVVKSRLELAIKEINDIPLDKRAVI